MSRRSKETLAVQLFPFLAVLVCTMGSLILLLIVTTKRIRAATIEKARQAVLAEIVVPELTPEAPPQLLPGNLLECLVLLRRGKAVQNYLQPEPLGC